MKYLPYALLPIFIVFSSSYISLTYSQTITFSYTGAVQSWTVPAGVVNILVDIKGATGGASYQPFPVYNHSRGGYGAWVRTALSVTPGQVLNIYVGGKGSDAFVDSSAGGFNGGGLGRYRNVAVTGGDDGAGGGGGGASDIRVFPYSLYDRVVVAGGGGGGGADCLNPDESMGGDAGATTGGHGYECGLPNLLGGQGGNATSGGIGGAASGFSSGTPGYFGMGGLGGDGTSGGGGGGGWYGGGGGCYGAGGAGSSYVNTALTVSTTYTTAYIMPANGAVSFTVVPTIIITGMPNVCYGNTTSLLANFPGGVWSSNSPGIATVNPITGILTGVSPGSALIKYTVGFSTDTMSVTVYPPVITGSISGLGSILLGDSTILTDSVLNGVWSSSDTSIATIDSSGKVFGVAQGTDTIVYTVTSGDGCSATTKFILTVFSNTDSNVSVKNSLSLAGNSILIAPNPANKLITITSSDLIYKITIVNILGRITYEQVYNIEKAQVDISGLPEGMYFIKINDTAVRMFVKD